MTHLRKLLLLNTLIALLLACTGKQGDVGPKGADGLNGSNGKDGNPAVIYSNWISAPASSTTWRKLDTNLWAFAVTSSSFTKATLNNAELAVYFRTSSTSSSASKLPFSFTTVSGTSSSTTSWNVLLYETGFSVWQSANYALTSPWDVEFRWVLIPGGTLAGGRKEAVDLSDYEAVKQAYHLPD